MKERASRLAIAGIETLPLLFGLCLWLGKLSPLDGKLLGHDYYHAYTRLYLGASHFWRFGLAVPHYTPYLLGGIPLFADPQSYYYSMPQWLTFLVPPWPATQLTYLIFGLLGYFGAKRVFEIDFAVSSRIAKLLALAFLLNGFTFSHLFVGHLTHHAFFLLPWMLHWMLQFPDSRRERWQQASRLTLFTAYCFFSGAVHMLVVFAGMVALFLPWLVEKRRREGKLGEWVGYLAATAALVLIACGGKLVAGALYSRTFVHKPIDSVHRDPFSLFFLYFFLRPSATPLMIPFVSHGGPRYLFGAWEYVAFLSKATLPLAAVGLAFVYRRYRPKRVVTLATILVFGSVLLIAAGGPINDFLPFLRRYHNPIKCLASLILPLLLLAALALEALRGLPRFRSLSPAASLLLFVLAGLSIAFEFSSQANFFVGNKLGIGYQYDERAWQALRHSLAPMPVSKITTCRLCDDTAEIRGESSLRASEPLFGYQLEAYRGTLRPGAPMEIRRDAKGVERFNATHPGCLVYPDYFHCAAWDRVPASEKEPLERFLKGEPAWGVPPWQTGLLDLGWSVLAVLFAVAVVPRRLLSAVGARPRAYAEAV